MIGCCEYEKNSTRHSVLFSWWCDLNDHILLPAVLATLGQASVHAERHCTADFHSSSSGPRLTTTLQPTLASSPRKDLVLLAVLVYRCLHVSAPGYLASDLQRVSDVDARWRLRSLSTSALVSPRTLHATISDCVFPATAASVWNSLWESFWASSSLQVFHGRLKTELFSRSYSCSD